MRDLFPTRILLRVTEPEHVGAVAPGGGPEGLDLARLEHGVVVDPGRVFMARSLDVTRTCRGRIEDRRAGRFVEADKVDAVLLA